eukprot:PhM_4_TR13418/c0_g1_i1/m.58417
MCRALPRRAAYAPQHCFCFEFRDYTARPCAHRGRGVVGPPGRAPHRSPRIDRRERTRLAHRVWVPEELHACCLRRPGQDVLAHRGAPARACAWCRRRRLGHVGADRRALLEPFPFHCERRHRSDAQTPLFVRGVRSGSICVVRGDGRDVKRPALRGRAVRRRAQAVAPRDRADGIETPKPNLNGPQAAEIVCCGLCPLRGCRRGSPSRCVGVLKGKRAAERCTGTSRCFRRDARGAPARYRHARGRGGLADASTPCPKPYPGRRARYLRRPLLLDLQRAYGEEVRDAAGTQRCQGRAGARRCHDDHHDRDERQSRQAEGHEVKPDSPDPASR